MDLKMYVGNLAFSTGEEELRTLFAQAGTITSVNLITDRDTGRSRGFAFIEMSAQTEVEDAIKRFNNYDIGGRALTVNIARPREERGGPGGYRKGPIKHKAGRGGRRY